jgi:hypothetical protein
VIAGVAEDPRRIGGPPSFVIRLFERRSPISRPAARAAFRHGGYLIMASTSSHPVRGTSTDGWSTFAPSGERAHTDPATGRLQHICSLK